MNKLEEQLRASRQTEVPGLKPPAGGWEAISGKLAAEAGAGASAGGAAKAAGTSGGGGAVASTTTKAILIKWLAGLGGLLMVASVTTYLVVTEPGSDATDTVTPVEVAAKATDAVSSIGSAEPSSSSSPQTTSETDNSSRRERPVSVQDASATKSTIDRATPPQADRTADTNLPSKHARPTTPPTPTPADPTELTDRQPTTATKDKPALDQRVADLPLSPTVAEIPEALGESEPSSPSTISSEALLVRANEPDTSTAAAPVASSEVEAASPPTTSSVNDPSGQPAGTSLASQVMSVQALSAAPAPVVPTFGVRSKHLAEVLPVPSIDLNGQRRNGKPKARAEWQLYGSISGSNSPVYNDQVLERAPAQQASQLFQLPSGETIYGNFRRTATTNNRQNSVRLRVGIDRQKSSGFLIRSGIGLYLSDTSVDPGGDATLEPNEIRVEDRVTEFIIPLELNLQYTFFKRHRFRPYVGIGTFTTLLSSGSERTVFTEGLTDQVGLVRGQDVTEILPLYFDLSITAGFQYKLTSDWSVGAYLWEGTESNVFINAPIGLEARYTLK